MGSIPALEAGPSNDQALDQGLRLDSLQRAPLDGGNTCYCMGST